MRARRHRRRRAPPARLPMVALCATAVAQTDRSRMGAGDRQRRSMVGHSASVGCPDQQERVLRRRSTRIRTDCRS